MSLSLLFTILTNMVKIVQFLFSPKQLSSHRTIFLNIPLIDSTLMKAWGNLRAFCLLLPHVKLMLESCHTCPTQWMFHWKILIGGCVNTHFFKANSEQIITWISFTLLLQLKKLLWMELRLLLTRRLLTRHLSPFLHAFTMCPFMQHK